MAQQRGDYGSEGWLVARILLEFGARPGLRIWRNNTGLAFDGKRAIRFGVPGQGDISGIIAPNGRRLEIECKARTGRQSVQQLRFQSMIESHGGLYVLARTTEDVSNALS